MYSNREKAAEAQREINYRQFVYSKRIAAGKMTQKDADRKIAIMEEICDDYTLAADKEEEAGRLL